MSQNAAPWPKMIRAVYDSFNTGRHQGDAVARRVMDRTVSWLTAGLELSPRLQAKLIDNINMRTAYRVENPDEPIRLTRHQIAYAQRTNPEWFALGLEGEDEPAEILLKEGIVSAAIPQTPESFQQVFSSLSASIQHSFSSFSALFPQQALQLAQHLVSIAAVSGGSGATYSLTPAPKVMEWEGKKSNLDDEPMIRPEDGMRLASSQDMIAADAAHVPGAITPELNEQGAYRDVGGSHCQDGTAHRDHAQEAAPPVEVEVAVSFFHNKADAPPSANLEVGPDKFALVFSDADIAEEQLRSVCSPEWIDQFDRNGGEGIRLESRAAGASKTRFCMSPLYAGTDTFARKAPVESNAVAVLFWSDDAQPEQVTIIRGAEVTQVPLSKFYGRHPRAPTHKGVVQEAA